MERRFDMTDFEQSLKDHADQFRLIPSRRVWNGIYNNLHPGSRWPSTTIAIAFIITLITIGFLNNSSKKTPPEMASTSTVQGINDSKSTKNFNSDLAALPRSEEIQTSLNGNLSNSGIDNLESGKKGQNENLSNAIASKPDKSSDRIIEQAFSSNEKNASLSIENAAPAGEIVINNSDADYKINKQTLIEENRKTLADARDSFLNYNNFAAWESQQNNGPDYFIFKEAVSSQENSIDLFSQVKIKSASVVKPHVQSPEITAGQSKGISKKIRRKKNKNIEWTYYVTPLMSTPVFRGNTSGSSFINFSPLAIFQRTSSNGMIYHARPGFEAGAKMAFAFSKKWKAVTGFNLNYSDYNVISNLLHPTFATLTLKNPATGVPYAKNYLSFYGNGQSLNQVALKNYSLQFSIPVGLEYQIWGNKEVQISVASAIEPTLVLKSHSYIISADKRYYVEDPDLMRKMNLGGNFATFVTFGSGKIKWHIGPDVHYQLFSTYKSNYEAKEHLINYGIRIGISKK